MMHYGFSIRILNDHEQHNGRYFALF